VVEDGLYGCKQINVESQRRERDSLLNWMVHMIRVRKECPEIGWGELEILPTSSKAVLALCYSLRGHKLLILHNFDERPQEVRVRVPHAKSDALANLMEDEESHARGNGEHRIALDGYGYKWYRVGGFGYALNPEASTLESVR
jgi:maltose alpha-D-glucosyltransferase/alpha-amylase